jgi:hypothetical protein
MTKWLPVILPVPLEEAQREAQGSCRVATVLLQRSGRLRRFQLLRLKRIFLEQCLVTVVHSKMISMCTIPNESKRVKHYLVF